MHSDHEVIGAASEISKAFLFIIDFLKYEVRDPKSFMLAGIYIEKDGMCKNNSRPLFSNFC